MAPFLVDEVAGGGIDGQRAAAQALPLSGCKVEYLKDGIALSAGGEDQDAWTRLGGQEPRRVDPTGVFAGSTAFHAGAEQEAGSASRCGNLVQAGG